MIESQQDKLFIEQKSSLAPKLLAAVAALVITALVLVGYTLLRKRHAQDSGSLALSSEPGAAEPRQPPKALVLIDDPMLQGNKTTIAGTVKNTSKEKLEGLSVELELKRRQGGALETQLVALQPVDLGPEQEGRYSLELKAQDYGSARLIGLKAGANRAALPFTTAPGQKRPPERLEPKTVIVNKPSSGKRGEFLNTPDNPVRVP
jgi:hypothetical protein